MTSTYAATEDELQKQVVEWLNVALPPGVCIPSQPQ